MTDAISARPPATAPLPHARGKYGPAPGDDPEIENYDADISELWQNPGEGMTFGDLLDIINPLQHIPIVSTIYRMVTGDGIGVGPRLAGDTLFGGLPGLVAGAMVAAFESTEGHTVETQIAKLLGGGAPDTKPAPAQQIAAAAPAGSPEPAAPTPPEPHAPAVARPPGPPLFTAKHPIAPFPAAAGAARAMPAPTTAPARPAAAPEAAAGTASAPADKAAAERRRIAETVARAQAQQAALLLASLSPASGETPKKPARKEPAPARAVEPRPAPVAAARPPAPRAASALAAASTAAARPADPFRNHPFFLGPGASPEQISRAMEQALQKYERGVQARGAAR